MRPHPQFGGLGALVQPGQHVHPEFNVVALERADLGLVLVGKVAEVLVLDPDDVRDCSGKVHMELHQAAQRRQGAVGIGHHPPAAVEQVLADAEQQRPEDGLLAGEMAVDRRSADSGRGPRSSSETRLKPSRRTARRRRTTGPAGGSPWPGCAVSRGRGCGGAAGRRIWVVWLGSVTGASLVAK